MSDATWSLNRGSVPRVALGRETPTHRWMLSSQHALLLHLGLFSVQIINSSPRRSSISSGRCSRYLCWYELVGSWRRSCWLTSLKFISQQEVFYRIKLAWLSGEWSVRMIHGFQFQPSLSTVGLPSRQLAQQTEVEGFSLRATIVFQNGA